MREAEVDFLRRVIPPWQSVLGLRTAFDLVAEWDIFSDAADLGFMTTAADAREENVLEARIRHPGIDFRVPMPKTQRCPRLECSIWYCAPDCYTTLKIRCGRFGICGRLRASF